MFPNLKDIGIIGGAGPEAGVILAQQIIKISQEKYLCRKDGDFPYLSLFSFPFTDMLENEQKDLVAAQLKKLIQVECSQTRFWAIACNTLHCYLKHIELPNQFVNMLKETANFLLEKPIVFCSSTSKKHQIHKQFFDCDYPDVSTQLEIDRLIAKLVGSGPSLSLYHQFERLLFPHQTRQIVLGCTEFSLFNSFFDGQINIIDPLKITAERLCSLYYGEKNGFNTRSLES
jgi:aspartate racemase